MMRVVRVSAAAVIALVVAVYPAAAADFRHGGIVLTVPEGFVVERVAGPPLVERPVTAAIDERGRLYVADSSGSNVRLEDQRADPRHRIVRLEDVDGDGVYDRRTVFADRLAMLQGTMWHRGSLYAAAVPDIVRLSDRDDDGVADERSVWLAGQTLTGCGNDVHGPYLGPDGRFYWTKGAFAEQTFELPGLPGFRSRASHVHRARPDGGGHEVVLTGGMDNPVDVAFAATGERFLTATFLEWPAGGRRDGLVHAVYGGVYGKEHGVLDGHVRTGGLMPILAQLGPAAPCGLHVHSGFGLGAEFAGNAFACGFNTRTVSRHSLTREGATFSTRDTPFLTADSADFHPTDVIEDADGSLLICDTGGWYKLCCPTSQLEKPAVSGGIYRVRRAGAPPVEDPRGLRMAWDAADPAGLVRRLDDPRPAVVERAADTLARLGAEAVPHLADRITAEDATAAACRGALWTLSRIDGVEAARAAVRPALRHRDPDVRHVAAEVVGLHRDRAAVADLAAGACGGGLANARAAAEALGRIGGGEAVDALLEAAARDGDLVLRHTLIYALVECGLPDPVLEAVGSPDPRVRLVALVALDQMGRRGLVVTPPRERVIEACRAEDDDLRESALWIASQHPEWAGDVTEVFADALAGAAAAPRRREDHMVAMLAGLAVYPAAADAVAAACQAASPAVRGAALAVMRSARMRAAPESWIGAIGGIAAGARAVGDAAGLAEAATAVRTLAALPTTAEQRATLRSVLLAIAADPRTAPAVAVVAVQAAGAKPAMPPEVSERLVGIVVSGDAASGVSPLERSAAAGLLATTPLADESLERIVGALPALPAGDVTTLLPLFTARGGDILAGALVAVARMARPELVGRERLAEAVAALDGPATEAGRELLARVEAARMTEREAYDRLVRSLPPGDPVRGHLVYNSTKAACTTCHAMAYAGGRIGPDLTGIGKLRSPADLLESIVLPSQSFVRSYEPVTVVTADGRVASGIVREQTDAEIVIQTNATTAERFPREIVESLEPGSVSIMPKGYDTLLSPQELSDLVAFLARRP